MSIFRIDDKSTPNQLPSALSPRINSECKMRTFFLAFYIKGSVALEGCIVTSLFLLFIFSIVYSLQMIKVQTIITSALHQAGNEIIFMGDSFVEDIQDKELYVKSSISKYMGVKASNHSCLSGEMDFTNSRIMENDDIVFISVAYELKPLIVWLMPQKISAENKYYAHAWTGYDVYKNKDIYSQMVYVTKSGSVYHKQYDCSYLHPTVKSIFNEDLNNSRNKGGAIYYACQICGLADKPNYYITEFGNKYHSNRFCSGLKRTIYIVPVSRAMETGFGSCSKCGR